MLYVISSGQAQTHTLRRADEMAVLSGGRSIGSVIIGGYAEVASGGVAQSDLVERHGVEAVDDGGLATGTILDAGGLLVREGGVAKDAQVGSGGVLEVAVDGDALDAHVRSGGYLTVDAGGRVQNTTVSQGGAAVFAEVSVSSGQHLSGGFASKTFEGVTLDSGAFCGIAALTVSGGGSVALGSQAEVEYADVLVSGRLEGGEVLEAEIGGVLADAVIYAERTSDNSEVEAGGLAIRVGIAGQLIVDSAGRTDRAVLGSRGREFVASGASAVRTIVLDGGELSVDSGGRTTAVDVESGGILTAGPGADVDGGVIHSGGLATLSATVSGGQTLRFSGRVLAAGARLDGVDLKSGAELTLVGATVASGARVLGTGALPRISGATIASGALVERASFVDAQLVEQAGGDMVSCFVQADAELSGQVQNLHDGGGRLTIAGGVVVEGLLMTGYGQAQVLRRGVVSRTVLKETDGYHSPTLALDSGAKAFGTVISSGAAEFVASGALATGTVVRAFGVQTVDGFTSGLRVSAGGVEIVRGVVDDAVVSSGGDLDMDGTGSNVRVLSGGSLNFGNVMVDAGESLSMGVREADGEVDGVTVASGAILQFTRATVNAGGTLSVGSGTVCGAELAPGALLVDDGLVSATALDGMVRGSGTLVIAGATVRVGDASAFAGQVFIDEGAALVLTDAADLRHASIGFSTRYGDARLVLSGAAAPLNGGRLSATLAGFDQLFDQVDLADVAFVSGATATLSGGTLTLVDGGYTASFRVTGHKASSYTVVSDGGSGALLAPVSDPWAGASVIVQAAAGVPATSAAPSLTPAPPATAWRSAFLARPAV